MLGAFDAPDDIEGGTRKIDSLRVGAEKLSPLCDTMPARTPTCPAPLYRTDGDSSHLAVQLSGQMNGRRTHSATDIKHGCAMLNAGFECQCFGQMLLRNFGICRHRVCG